MMADMMSMMTPAAPAPAPKKKAAKRKPAKKAAKKTTKKKAAPKKKAAKKTTKKKAAPKKKAAKKTTKKKGRPEEEGCQEDDEEEGRPEEEGCQEDHEEEGRPEEEGCQEDHEEEGRPEEEGCQEDHEEEGREEAVTRAADHPLQVCDGSKTGGSMPPVFNSGAAESRWRASPRPRFGPGQVSAETFGRPGGFRGETARSARFMGRCAARSAARACALTAPTRLGAGRAFRGNTVRYRRPNSPHGATRAAGCPPACARYRAGSEATCDPRASCLCRVKSAGPPQAFHADFIGRKLRGRPRSGSR